MFSFDKNKAVKTTRKVHFTRCFKCHMIGHYANKCQNHKPLVTLENDVGVENGYDEVNVQNPAKYKYVFSQQIVLGQENVATYVPEIKLHSNYI